MNTAQVPDSDPEAVATSSPSGIDRAWKGMQAWLSEPSSSWPKRIVAVALTRYATVILLIALIVVFSIVTPDTFLTGRNWDSILVVQVVVATMTLAALIPLVAGEFDLSLGYMIGFLAMLGAYLGGQGHSSGIIMPAMLLAGLVIGLINGILTVRFNISSFIATLGVGIVLNGLTLGLSNGQTLFTGIPPLITTIGQDHFLGVANSVWVTIGIGLVLLYVLEHTPAGRYWYAVGGSERVARLAGVPTSLMKIAAFGAAGFLVGIAGLFALGQNGAATPGYGPDLLLPAYAAAFLGVTTYRPGYYNVPGAFVAILLLAVGFNGLSLLGVPFWVQPVFNGAVLLLAVLLARAESRHVRVG